MALSERRNKISIFCALEHKKYVDKTIKKLVLNDVQTITTQNEILKNVQAFYVELYVSKESQLQDVANNLEGILSIHELSTALKNRNNNKTLVLIVFLQTFSTYSGQD